MTFLTEKLKAAVEYDTKAFQEAASIQDMNTEDREHLEFLRGEWNENVRLQPILHALIEVEVPVQGARGDDRDT